MRDNPSWLKISQADNLAHFKDFILLQNSQGTVKLINPLAPGM